MIRSLIILLAVAASALMGAGVANAASPYDNTLTTTDQLLLTNDKYSFVKDITDTWDIQFGQSCGQTTLEHFKEQTDKSINPNSAYIIYQYSSNPSTYYDGYQRNFYIAYTSDYTKLKNGTQQSTLTFTGSGTEQRLLLPINGSTPQSDLWHFWLRLEPYSQQVTCGNLGTGSSPTVSQPSYLANPGSIRNTVVTYLFANVGFPVTYPEGYQGQDVPGLPSQITEEVPDIEIVSGQNYNFKARDKRFNTFDPVPWTCDDSTAPILHYQIYKGQEETGNELFTEGAISSTIQIQTKLDPSTDYTMVSWYNCGGSPSFTKSAFTQFSITTEGLFTDTPQWYIENILDFKLTAYDKNFFTFDEVPFTCTDGTGPIVHYEIFSIASNGTETRLHSGVYPPSVKLEYQFAKANVTRDYLLLGWYDCGPNDPIGFTGQGRITFTITQVGTLQNNLFEECWSEEFPFFHMDACYNNLVTVFNLLAFPSVQFPTFNFNPQCVTLSTMDDWLGLPQNTQVCPQIPSSVRSVVTPFVFFLLGIVTIGAIRKFTGKY